MAALAAVIEVIGWEGVVAIASVVAFGVAVLVAHFTGRGRKKDDR